jgi:hypothetical protein
VKFVKFVVVIKHGKVELNPFSKAWTCSFEWIVIRAERAQNSLKNHQLLFRLKMSEFWERLLYCCKSVIYELLKRLGRIISHFDSFYLVIRFILSRTSIQSVRQFESKCEIKRFGLWDNSIAIFGCLSRCARESGTSKSKNRQKCSIHAPRMQK